MDLSEGDSSKIGCSLGPCFPHSRQWQEQLGTFLNHFMLVPGYSTEDVRDTDLGLPEHCQEFMQDMWRADVKQTVARVAETWPQSRGGSAPVFHK